MSTPGTAGTSGATVPAGYRLAGSSPDTLKGLQNQRVDEESQNGERGRQTGVAADILAVDDVATVQWSVRPRENGARPDGDG